MYSHVRVSILNTSPMFTNIGTCNSNPVSNVAGFPDVVVVFPANPGSVYVTSNSTNVGGSDKPRRPGSERCLPPGPPHAGPSAVSGGAAAHCAGPCRT